ncbi:Phosphoribosylformylglycinamidine synthase [termite gut metagenome]|uniref:phosphoribosylformylglycinamidine synthase n=1 Tax=termite gut metagenome TaxID=433724 RepID=A0A5J4SMK7_9ZZZZ
MILFFRTSCNSLIAVEHNHKLTSEDIKKLCWLLGEAMPETQEKLTGHYIGPRREMITPWSTNAVEITQNMGIIGITRIEEYFPAKNEKDSYDPMLQRMYEGLDSDLFTTRRKPEPILYIDDLEAYNEKEGLALSKEEMDYLKKVGNDLGRKLTDSEIFGFAQINSEHCRHKIFGGTFIIDGIEMESSLFQLIKKTTQENPNRIISAYKDNVAFAAGPVVEQFAPADHSTSGYFTIKDIETVISLKAETHNFPTTVEPFNGASTGTGGEIRDRMGGGKGSLPIAGTAVYMTSYPRTNAERTWEQRLFLRNWLYQTPEQILIKASNGASDFGNKFGQPLICGSVLTFEHKENDVFYGYDKVIMLAGGVGYGARRDSLKEKPQTGNKIVVMGGDNYRIGLGGGSVSSVDTGRYDNSIELNAVQRANAEMQKRTYNVIRALCEEDKNPIVSIHDHGSAGHVNCLSELVEDCGGLIDMNQLPIGDKTLSAKEIIANESQERMGLLIKEEAVNHVRKIAGRERAPMYVVGETTGDGHFAFQQADGIRPFDLTIKQMFGSSPETYLKDNTVEHYYENPAYKTSGLQKYLTNVLQLEAVACKDWLTNKVDRSVTGKIARQQCQGELQLPVSDCGVAALDYRGVKGIAVSIGHAPQAALADPEAGSILAVAEALTNIIWAPLTDGLDSLSLSANWMWPCRSQEGEDARLYKAVKALSDFCCKLKINVPTGKDSLSMTQKYPDGSKVISPGTVIISAGAEVSDIKKVIPQLSVPDKNSTFYHIDFSFDALKLGGSALAQSLGKIGNDVPCVQNAEYFRDTFLAVQELINKDLILAGHDISAGGLITTLLEMCFPHTKGGMKINLNQLAEKDIIKILFAENPGVIIQVKDKHKNEVEKILEENGTGFAIIGKPDDKRYISVSKDESTFQFDVDYLREVWYSSSYLLDCKQSMNGCAEKRMENYKEQPVEFVFPTTFKGKFSQYSINPNRRTPSGIRAAILREKGTNGEREMAYSLYLAGFDVKDVTMTDLISGNETLQDVHMIVFCGGFSNSDVLGSAKGWAGGFLFNEKAKTTLDNFYARKDTLSLGVCNGCQLMMELGLINPGHEKKGKMLPNESRKFESSFISITIPVNHSILFGSLSHSKLGIWVAHGEGKFSLPYEENQYHIAAKYNYNEYPGNPNGSDYSVAALASADGRHLAMMPHLERAVFPWQNAYYPANRITADQITPWIEAFVNAREWISKYGK